MDYLDKFQSDNADNRWFCIMTYGREEFSVVDRLNELPQAGPINAYCPINLVEFTPRTRKKKTNPKVILLQKPMIPGYIFLSMRPSDMLWYRVRSTRGVYGVLVNNNLPVRVSHELVMVLRSAEADVCKQEPVIDDRLVEGDMAIIERGQWKGQRFVIKAINGPLATLDATLFGKPFPLVLPLSFLVHGAEQLLPTRAHAVYKGV